MITQRIKYRLGLLRRSILFRLGLGSRLLKNRYGERILVFHNVDVAGGTKYNSRSVSQAYFEELVLYFKKHFNIISLADFYDRKFEKGKLNIALTFDDGLENNYTLAKPVLEKYNVPATFFITPIYDHTDVLWADYIDLVSVHTQKKAIDFDGARYTKNRKNEFVNNGTTLKNRLKQLEYEQINSIYDIFSDDWNAIKSQREVYWKLLSAEQLREIGSNPLFTLGAHGMTHANLAAIDRENARNEIEMSKTTVESVCGTTIDAFAFPFGAFNDTLVAHCKAAGFSKILLVDSNNENDRRDAFLRERFVVNPYISKKQLIACLLKGSYY
jgi:peptidoglycan/xylan/chitin deacetylase (PgdA/CDA1 family)